MCSTINVENKMPGAAVTNVEQTNNKSTQSITENLADVKGNKSRTLIEDEPEDYALIMAMTVRAMDEISEDKYMRVAPILQDKTLGSLLFSWGAEMLRWGFEKGLHIADFEKMQAERKAKNKGV